MKTILYTICSLEIDRILSIFNVTDDDADQLIDEDCGRGVTQGKKGSYISCALNITKIKFYISCTLNITKIKFRLHEKTPPPQFIRFLSYSTNIPFFTQLLPLQQRPALLPQNLVRDKSRVTCCIIVLFVLEL